MIMNCLPPLGIKCSCVCFQTARLKREEQRLHDEVQALQTERSALQTETAQLKTRVEELRDELVTQKRKQAVNIKDLTKQLTQGNRSEVIPLWPLWSEIFNV